MLGQRSAMPALRWSLSRQRGGNGERRVHKLRNGPSLIGNAQRLRWRRAQGFMSAAQIVMRNIQRNCRNVIIKLLREAIGQASKTAAAHAERKVLPFNVAG
ncbi:hypothetical protein SAMN05444159_6335 [Bradyrhizobium lablabi]|uniref:Uncharacterized protein n=1 Tax=Bradyrhizobium lablabi TaxID=722472 RepID=A0A1M7BYZ2_9BRAD|nr:hypothetical protein SAMN05444159_6335 [Bradyrhizobium lablabi]